MKRTATKNLRRSQRQKKKNCDARGTKEGESATWEVRRCREVKRERRKVQGRKKVGGGKKETSTKGNNTCKRPRNGGKRWTASMGGRKSFEAAKGCRGCCRKRGKKRGKTNWKRGGGLNSQLRALGEKKQFGEGKGGDEGLKRSSIVRDCGDTVYSLE